MPQPKQVTNEEETIEELDYIEELEKGIEKSPTRDIDIKHIKIMKILLGEKAMYLADLEIVEGDITKECNDNIFSQRLPIVNMVKELFKVYKYLQLRQFSIDDQNQSYQAELKEGYNNDEKVKLIEEVSRLKEELNEAKKEKSEEEKLIEEIKKAIDEYNKKLEQFKKGKIDKSEVNLARGNVWLIGKDDKELTKELSEKFMDKGDNND